MNYLSRFQEGLYCPSFENRLEEVANEAIYILNELLSVEVKKDTSNNKIDKIVEEIDIWKRFLNEQDK